METAQETYDVTGLKQRGFHAYEYGAKTWDRMQRIILKAEHLDQGANARFVVTNLDRDPSDIYDGLYTQCGDTENRIKEQQLYLFADRTSCRRLVANLVPT